MSSQLDGVLSRGEFDRTLSDCWRITMERDEVILPTLGKDVRRTYSPFLPICPRTGLCCRCRWRKVDPERDIVRDPTLLWSRRAVEGGLQAAVEGRLGHALVALSVITRLSGRILIDFGNPVGVRILRFSAQSAGRFWTLRSCSWMDNGEKISTVTRATDDLEDWVDLWPARELSIHVHKAEDWQAPVLRP